MGGFLTLRRALLGAENDAMGALGHRSIAGLSGINASLAAAHAVGEKRDGLEPPAVALDPEGRR